MFKSLVLATLLVCFFVAVSASDAEFVSKLKAAVQKKLLAKLKQIKSKISKKIAKKKSAKKCRKFTKKRRFAVRVLRVLAKLGGKLGKWSKVVRRLTKAIALHLRRKARKLAKKMKKAKKAKKSAKKMSVKSDFFPALIPIAAFAGKALAGGALSAAGAHAYDKFIRRRDAEEADFPFIPVAMGAWKLYNALKKKDSVESDFLGKWIDTAKRVYPKAKAVYGEGKNIYNSVQNIRKIIKNKDDVESEFLGKVFNKVKGVVGKGISIYNKAKPFIGVAKQFIDSEESDMVMNKEFLSKLKEKLMKKLQEKLAKLKEKKAQKKAEKKPVVQKEEADFKIDKCQICKAGCTLIKDEAKRNLCTQACETFACKKD